MKLHNSNRNGRKICVMIVGLTIIYGDNLTPASLAVQLPGGRACDMLRKNAVLIHGGKTSALSIRSQMRIFRT